MFDYFLQIPFFRIIFEFVATNLQAIGIIFQLIAGVVLASPMLFGRKPFKWIDSRLRNIINWLFGNYLRIVLFGFLLAAIVPTLAIVVSIHLEATSPINWGFAVLYALFHGSLASLFYVIVISAILFLIQKNNRVYQRLKGTYWLPVLINIIAVVILFILIYIATLVLIRIAATTENDLQQSFSQLQLWNISLLLNFMRSFILALFSSIAFLIVTVVLKVVSIIAAPIRRPFWALVILLYLVGGIFLLLAIE